VFSGGYVVGTSLGGKLYTAYENYYLNFGISIGLGLVGILAGVLIKESVRPNPSQSEEVGNSDIFWVGVSGIWVARFFRAQFTKMGGKYTK
jgi:hypothetical protein